MLTVHGGLSGELQGGCPRGMRQKPHTAARTPPLPRGPLQGIERKGDRVALQRIFIKGGGAYENLFSTLFLPLRK